MTDIISHIEAIRSIFKKRFSGEFSYLNGNKSPDIFRGKDDLEDNFDWKNYGDELVWQIILHSCKILRHLPRCEKF